jgi:ketosteroid isomerase-like protein
MPCVSQDDDIAVIERAFELFNRMLDPEAPERDRKALAEAWVDEPEIVPLRAALEGGTVYTGPDALDRFRRESREMWAELEIEVVDIAAHGPRYLVEARWRGRGRSSGAEVRAPLWFVVDFRDGRIARGAAHVERESALAELG